ncbi:MAG: N-6 DNA methylase [Bacteroidota bacterium]
MALTTTSTKPNILQYESKVWATADLLIASGIKQSDFPKFMMPFFALILVESRLLRMADEKREEFGLEKLEGEDLEEFLEEIKDDGKGYNDILLRYGKTLAEICKNDKTFDQDFAAYLRSFDFETQRLLGVERGNTEEKYLDISGIAGQLKKKRILFASVQAWSEIKLKPYNNSEVTTLEEHIKRKWADISAETAGEQYTPDDVIQLIAGIICSKLEKNDSFLSIYDPTCGGGNMLFGVEDYITNRFPNRPTKTFGQDWSDALYALAKIESRFRLDSQIEYGNTLVDLKFTETAFNISVANPPYGVDWKGYKKDILSDKTGRFKALPAVSDGQLLFTQHIVSQMANDGLAVVVHNGSTLFSGDAGSGESNIRKYFFDEDIVEAIIQLPTDEFFNTNIYTYLWIFNKRKKYDERKKGKVMLINASEHYVGLKKNKGKKRKEIDKTNREIIIQTLSNFKDTDFAKVFDKEYFYYNKQAILLQNLDVNGESFQKHLPWKTNRFNPEEPYQAKSIKFTPDKIEQGGIVIMDMTIKEFDAEKYDDLRAYYDDEFKPFINLLDYKEKDLVITHWSKEKYWFDEELNTIIKEKDGKQEMQGCGKIIVKATFKKANKSQPDRIEIHAELMADNEKDYEIIPFSADNEENQQNIMDFMAKYITKPFEYLDNTIGVEINFNKVFYKPEVLRPIEDIINDLEDLDKELNKLENGLQL